MRAIFPICARITVVLARRACLRVQRRISAEAESGKAAVANGEKRVSHTHSKGEGTVSLSDVRWSEDIG